jgi:23S rRNA (uracil1939-C5)-methyltransferase
MADGYRKPKPGVVVEFEIEGLTDRGIGVGLYGDYRVSVRGPIPGDRVVARIRKVFNRKKECDAQVVDRISADIERVAPDCQHFGDCGGCLWQDLPYPNQLKLKEKLVLDTVCPRSEVAIGDALGAPQAYGYRNKMEFSFGEGKDGSVEVGLHPAGQFGQIFDLKRCSLVGSEVNEIVEVVRRFAKVERLSVYGLKTHKGLLRFLTIREGTGTGELMVVVTTSGEPFGAAEQLGRWLSEMFPRITSVVHTVNLEKAQVAFGSKSHVLFGNGSIRERLGPFEYEVSPQSFFQPNVCQAERMFERVISLCELTGRERALDAYCGTGSISLYLSQHAERVLGVEVSNAAIQDAVRNSARNRIENTEFMVGPAEDLLGQLRDQGERFDVAVTDPPRAGMHHKALRDLIDLQPYRILYVSCNPKALASDLKTFEAHGYQLNYLQLVDMLPQTPHCEVLAQLDRVK